MFTLWVKITETNGQEALTDDEKNNPAGVAASIDEVVHQRLRGHIKHALLLPLYMETLRFVYAVKGLRLTASTRFLPETSPVNSTASLPGMPQVL
jgi:hypothetical protein